MVATDTDKKIANSSCSTAFPAQTSPATMRHVLLCLMGVFALTLLSECIAISHFGRNLYAAPCLHVKDSNITDDKKTKEKNVICVDGVCHVRGGEMNYQDDQYDDEYDEEVLPPPRRQRPPSGSRSPPPPLKRQRPAPPSGRRGPPHGSRRGPPPPYRRRPKQPSILNSAAGLAKKTASLTTSAAVGTVKGSGKAAFYLVSPKHVARREVWGVWRLDQQVNTDSDTPISSVANVEFTPRGEVIVKYKDEIYETTYLFRERSWPQSCSIEFEARAFQGPNDDEPVLVRYKGYFRRKLADSSIIKIVGTIYEVPRPGLWRKGRKGRKLGTFVARRRMTKKQVRREEEFDEYEDDYDFEENDEEVDFDFHDEEEYDVK